MLVVSLGKVFDEKKLALVENFLLRHEKSCVSLLERICRHEVSVYCILGERREIRAVFSYSSGGQILHCIPDALEFYDEYLVVLRIYFSNMDIENIFSVIGEEVGTNLILSAIYLATRKIPEINQTFNLMEYLPKKESKGAGLKFNPSTEKSVYAAVCSIKLLDALVPIQEAYEKEEVLSFDQEFNPLMSKVVLKKNLSEKNVYAVFLEGKIVAKAAVNATGKHCVQLGGVFTVPLYRKLGFAEFLIKKIVAEKNSLGKKIVLFVKPKNIAAVTLYKRCGFSAFSKFKISYY
ncbi:MAG: GNAT family N-acetyltransferase [Treponema sp.]|nr:GNAT family N-acetyltransferase [Treponema sp.]MCR5125586.1 GNAT family N-acetyltransferase [Treponema sp.]